MRGTKTFGKRAEEKNTQKPKTPTRSRGGTHGGQAAAATVLLGPGLLWGGEEGSEEARGLGDIYRSVPTAEKKNTTVIAAHAKSEKSNRRQEN